MIQELIKLIEELRKVSKQQNMNVSDSDLFNNACQFLRGQYANQRFTPIKGSAISNTKEEKSNKPDSDNFPLKLATDRQLEYAKELAKSLNITLKLTNDMTGKEVSEIIKELNKKKFAK